MVGGFSDPLLDLASCLPTRPIQSISCDGSELVYVCRSVCPRLKTPLPGDRRLLVKERIANIGIPLDNVWF